MIEDFSTISGQQFLWINIKDYSVPVYVVDSTKTAMSTVQTALGGTGFRQGAANDYAAPGSGQAPIPSGATPAAGTDRHLAIVDKAAHTEWGFFNMNSSASGWKADLAASIDLSGSGVRPAEQGGGPWWAGAGPRACGYPLSAGLITREDIASGAIQHALVIAYPHIRSRYYTSPASSAQGTFATAQPDRGMPCGTHIQLDPSYPVSKLHLATAGNMIARALQKYGAFVGDLSGAVSLYAEASPEAIQYWNGGVLSSQEVKMIPLGAFRVLKIGALYDNGN
jgi:hypothetical protein